MKTPELIDEAPTTLREDELDELGFEEDDEPTQMLVDPRPLSKKPSTIVPPRIDEGDVYMLTEQHLRYKAGIVPMDEERVDLRDIMRAAPSLPPMSEPEPELRSSPRSEATRVLESETVAIPRANSLSPVAMSNGDTTVPPAVATIKQRPHPAWPATLAVLSVAAVGVFFIRPSSFASASGAAAPGQAPVVMTQPVQEPAAAVGTGSLELAPVEIQAAASPAQVAMPISGQLPVAAQAPASPAAPAAAPDQAQAPAPTAEELPPVEPPPPELPPFDRSVAASALNAAAGSASSCREPGVPSSPVSVRVTFAPSGSVTIAVVENAPYAGTAAGGCIARVFRSARVPAFSGTPVTVHKTFQLD